MNPTTTNIEERLDRLVNLYEGLDEWLDMIPGLPAHARNKIKKALLDSEITRLVDGIKNRRPPRFALVGRTGVGKSSLINALCGCYLAKTSDVVVGTDRAEKYSYGPQGKTLFEVIDTRGLAESLETGGKPSSEDQLIQTIKDFQPDAILFLSRCKERARLNEDVDFLSRIANGNDVKVPTIAILTQSDEMEPSREKTPKEYPAKKRENIDAAGKQLEQILNDQNVQPLDVLPVSAYIEWNQGPTTLEPDEWERLRIEFDGRYNIDRLIDLLEENIDIRASIALTLAARADQAGRKLSEKLTNIFAGVASTIALVPIPALDYPILLGLQVTLVMIIAYLAGRDMSYKTAREFVVAAGAMGAVGFGLRALAQQTSKLLNALIPAAGSAVSSGVAGAATWGIGKAAIRYFLDNSSAEEARITGREAATGYYSEQRENHDD